MISYSVKISRSLMRSQLIFGGKLKSGNNSRSGAASIDQASNHKITADSTIIMPAIPPTTPPIIAPFLSGCFVPPGLLVEFSGLVVVEVEDEEEEEGEEVVRLVEAMLGNWVEEDFVVWDTVVD